mmetsp:Transcript_2332/g.4702  ORF Transcript_2332/g.4702 Transcript_2332/m.4702 type:complete len:215 (+) Transcript_2332:853-1497(+)
MVVPQWHLPSFEASFFRMAFAGSVITFCFLGSNSAVLHSGHVWDAGSPSEARAARRQNSSRHERQNGWRHGSVWVAASSTSVHIGHAYSSANSQRSVDTASSFTRAASASRSLTSSTFRASIAAICPSNSAIASSTAPRRPTLAICASSSVSRPSAFSKRASISRSAFLSARSLLAIAAAGSWRCVASASAARRLSAMARATAGSSPASVEASV